MPAELKIISDKLPALLEALPGLVSEIVRKTAMDIVADAQARSRFKIGQMRAGWIAEQTGAQEWTVSNSVEHTIYNEFGTVHMAAQPMLTPASEAARQPFQDAFAAIEGLV